MALLGRRFDFQLGGKGYMLQRGQFKGRTWTRTGTSDAPSQRSAESAKFGVVPDELDHPEVWDDWTGGFGHAYRRTGAPTYHWSENFDGRFPRQLVHCQNPLPVHIDNTGSFMDNVTRLVTVAPPFTQSQGAFAFNQSKVVVGWDRGQYDFVPDVTGSLQPINGLVLATGNVYGHSVTTNSGTFMPALNSSGNPLLRLWGNGYAGAVLTYTLPYLHMINSSDRIWIAIGGSGNLRAAVQSIIGDPTVTANLTATLLVGTSITQINDLAVLDDQLIVGTPDGLYIGDLSGSFINAMPWLAQSYNPDNLRDLLPYNSGLICQTVVGVYRYLSSGISAEVRDIEILRGRSPIQGYVRSLGAIGPWVYGALWTGSATHLIANQPDGAPQWHTLHKFPSHSVGRISFDGITTASSSSRSSISPRIYAAMLSDRAATMPLYAWQVPFNDDNPLVSQVSFSANYIGSARMDLGSVDWGSPGTPKVFRDLEIWSDQLSSGALWCQVLYDVDHSGSFTVLGTSAKSPKDTLYFPSGEGSFVTGQSIELSLRSFTATGGLSPIYRALVLRGALDPRSIDTITAVVRIADNIRDRQGQPLRSGATMIQELRDFANPDSSLGGPHQLIDLAGATQFVKVLGRPEEQEVLQTGEEFPEVAATVRMSVLTYS